MEKKGPPHIIHFFLDFLFFCQKSWGGFACNGLWLRLSLHSTSVCLEQRSPSLSSPSSLKKSFSPPKLKKKKKARHEFLNYKMTENLSGVKPLNS